jgi:hypothetical protein
LLKGSFALFWPAHILMYEVHTYHTHSHTSFTLPRIPPLVHTHAHTISLSLSHTHTHTRTPLSLSLTHTYPDVPLHQISRVCVCVREREREPISLSHFRHCVVYRHPLSPPHATTYPSSSLFPTYLKDKIRLIKKIDSMTSPRSNFFRSNFGSSVKLG